MSPVEIYRAASTGGAPVPLTHLNDQTLNDYQLTSLEEFWVDGADGAKVQSFVVKPPNFNPARKYPVLMLIHGGPQGYLGTRLDVPLERAGLRRGGLRGGDAESARVDGLRPEVHRRDQRRLGRARRSTTSWRWPTTS